jgi:hypothetical protein
MTLYVCANDRCKNLVLEHGQICDDCKAEARRLQHWIQVEDTPQHLDKHDGETRHIKNHWRGRK